MGGSSVRHLEPFPPIGQFPVHENQQLKFNNGYQALCESTDKALANATENQGCVKNFKINNNKLECSSMKSYHETLFSKSQNSMLQSLPREPRIIFYTSMMFSNLYRFAHASIKNDFTKNFKTKLSNLIALDYLSRERSL